MASSGLFSPRQSGNDNILINDTAVPTIINFGNGNDNAVVGTVPLIPDTGNRTLDFPNGVPVVNTKAMTNGNSNDLFIMGGSGDDTFEVDHNSAMLYLHGGVGHQSVPAQDLPGAAQQSVQPQPDHESEHDLRRLAETTATSTFRTLPVDIVGGSGYNTIVIVGTPIGDTFIVGNNYIAGAGRIVNFSNIQSIEVDGAGGNDTIYVLATNPNLTITVNGGHRRQHDQHRRRTRALGLQPAAVHVHAAADHRPSAAQAGDDHGDADVQQPDPGRQCDCLCFCPSLERQ